VKALRLCLLVLLALLLPLRGAVAAAMLCPGGQAAQAQLSVPMMADPAAMHHDHAAMLAAQAHAQHGGGQHGDGEQAKCNSCCDFCALSSLPAAEPQLPAVPVPVTAIYAPLQVPAASFVSVGPERPPRHA
jgi:hypothetical protein